jgi:hypothetical protein
MNRLSSLQCLRRHTLNFRYIAFGICSFSFLFLALSIFIGQQRMVQPELFTIYYIGILLGAIQIPLSIYMWRFIPWRIPPVQNEKLIVAGFRMTMLVCLLLCAGIVLYAGIASILTGYTYPSAIMGGIALGAMVYHLPGERTYELFVRGLSGK